MYTPTMFQKIGTDYFIIDCWHHRILYSVDYGKDIAMWNVLTDDIRGGHTIAGDGDLYLCDDTDYNALRVFRKAGERFKQTQILGGIGTRPHFVFYDQSRSRFFCLSSLGGMFWTLLNDGGTLKVERSFLIAEIADTYVRSFSLIDGFLYLISGNGFIWKLLFCSDGYRVKEKYAVPAEMAGMNCLAKIGGWFYISSYQNEAGAILPMFVRTRDLRELHAGIYEDLYGLFGFKGVPYYITAIDGRYFITEIDGASGVKSFAEHDGCISDIRTHFFFAGHTAGSYARRMEKY